jgi:Mn2+/Fe2+ NRAMP family transporter
MYAGAAIGVSHLVQSTRAGADYGFTLVWVVIAIHLFKYPFFEYGHRYTAATGDSLLVGYQRLGRWALVGFLLIAFGLSIPTTAVLTIVTAGMASQLVAAKLAPMTWALVLLACCVILLASGGYPLLDKVMKVLMAFLAISTLVAVVAAARHGPSAPAQRCATAGIWNVAGIGFLVALMGWMPTPVDASAWPSLWMQQRIKQTGHRPTLREALFDFKLGYGGSLVMALMFLSLGALIMFGTGETFAGQADGFAAQFIRMYTNALGIWSRPLVVAAAFATMLSTLLTVLDGYPRVLTASSRLAWPGPEGRARVRYWAFMVVMMVGALLIFRYVTSVMRPLVDFTMTLAFLSAPLFAYLNCRVISSAELPQEAVPPQWLRFLSWAGLVLLVCFSALFLVLHFGYRA